MTQGDSPDMPSQAATQRAPGARPSILVRLARHAALFAACAALLFAGGYYRFHLITTEGIHEGDTVGYYALAKRWASGTRTDFLGDQFYRPVVYFISELAIRWFGDNDYSIKAVNGAFDVANILLMLLIARHLSGSWLPGLAAGTLYALLPYEIEMCRSGMPHAISGTFVLLSLYVFRPRSRVLSADPLRLPFDAAAGFALGLAMNTHAELGFIGVGVVACQAIQVFSVKHDARAFGWFVLRAAVITLATLAPYGIGVLIFGYEKVHKVLSKEIGISAFSPEYVEEAPLYRVPLDVLGVTSTFAYEAFWWMPAFFAVPAVAWCIQRILARTRRPFAALTPWILVLSYMAIFPVIIGAFDRTHARIFLPMLPLVQIAAACALFGLPGPRRPLRSAALLALGWGGVLVAGPNVFEDEGYFKSNRYRKSIYRSAYDVIGDRVNSHHRLLILPSTAYRDSGFSLPLYFGEDVEYLAAQSRSEPYTAALIERITETKRFSYYLLSGQLDFRVLDPNWASVMKLPPWFKGPAYDVDTERTMTERFLSANRAHMIARLESADVYSTRKQMIFPNSMFERGNLQSWHATGFQAMFVLSPTEQEISPFRVDTRLRIRYPADSPQQIATAGELISDPFTIGDDLIGMVIAGDNDPESIHVALRVSGTELRAVPSGPELAHAQWDVSEYRGERAQLVIRDLNPAIEQGISVAGFYYVF